MISRRLVLVVALIPLSAPALADPRIATRLYQPGEIVTIHGRPDTQSTVSFAPDERIENVAVGDSGSWQVTPNKRADLLFVKPMKPAARTNMTVVTDRRTYLFDLIVAPRSAVLYMLRFTYPTIAKPAAAIVPSTVEAAIVPVAPSPAPDPDALDFAWAGKGDKALLPSRAFDDGHSTWLAWPADAALPAILVREAGGAEGPVNYVVRNGYVVVEGVPAQLVLRSGKRMATLTSIAHATGATTDGGEVIASNQAIAGRPLAHVADGRP